MPIEPQDRRPVRRTLHLRGSPRAPAFAGRRGDAAAEAQREQDVAASVDRARQALNVLDEQLRVDPDYSWKRAILIETAGPLLRSLPPEQWLEAFAGAYNRLTRLLAAAVQTSAQTSALPPGFELESGPRVDRAVEQLRGAIDPASCSSGRSGLDDDPVGGG